MTISKDDVESNLLSGCWNIDESFLRIYKLPESSDIIEEALDRFDIIRLAGDSHGIVYFWNGGVFHRLVAQVLNLHWDLALVYDVSNDYLELSKAYKVDSVTFKKYLTTDKVFIKILKQVQAAFLNVVYIKICNEKILISDYC